MFANAVGIGSAESRINVTRHPTNPWITQQLREAFPYSSSCRYLICDRDAKFGEQVNDAVTALNLNVARTSFCSPWQNGVAGNAGWKEAIRHKLSCAVLLDWSIAPWCVKVNRARLMNLLDWFIREMVAPKVFAMIEAYLDESGIHDAAIVCVIAGFFGGRGQWKKFETLWRKTLDDFEVPLEEFHATNLIRQKDFFSGWKDEDHADFLRALAKAITAYKVHPVSLGLVVADYKACSHPQRRFLTGARLKPGKPGQPWKLITTGAPGKHYFCPFQECTAKVLDYTPVGGKANFFFGLDRSFYKYAAYFMKELVDDPYAPFHERIGTTAYPLAKETPQLQAADFYAYLTYVDLLDRATNNKWGQDPPELLGSLLIRARSAEDFQYYEKESIQKHFDNTYKFAGNWDGH